MSDKIPVEDLTKPPDRSEAVKILAESLFFSSTRDGLVLGVGYKEVLEAVMMCAEFTALYAQALGEADSSDVRANRRSAVSYAKERLKMFQETGFIDIVKEASRQMEADAEAILECMEKAKGSGDES
jgi:hypothetical protein